MTAKKVDYSATAIIQLADFVIDNYAQVKGFIAHGVALAKKTYGNIKLTKDAVLGMFRHTAQVMQAVENEGVLKGIDKKLEVLKFVEMEYVRLNETLHKIWGDWYDALNDFIDDLIAMLNAGRKVLAAQA